MKEEDLHDIHLHCTGFVFLTTRFFFEFTDRNFLLLSRIET